MDTSTTPRTLIARLHDLMRDEQGSTAIEYALVASGIAVAIAATVFSFGSNLKSTFYDKIAAIL
jgi:pilus assembly protein Flp/PilA